VTISVLVGNIAGDQFNVSVDLGFLWPSGCGNASFAARCAN
jgi:hypothetical protein